MLLLLDVTFCPRMQVKLSRYLGMENFLLLCHKLLVRYCIQHLVLLSNSPSYGEFGLRRKEQICGFNGEPKSRLCFKLQAGVINSQALKFLRMGAGKRKSMCLISGISRILQRNWLAKTRLSNKIKLALMVLSFQNCCHSFK